MQEITSKHFIGRVSAKAIIVRDSAVLITLGFTKNGNAVWDLPGGRMHQNETPEETVKREVAEELGISIQTGPLVFMKQFMHVAGPTLLVAYEATLEHPDAEFTLPTEEVDQVRWIDKELLASQKIFGVCREALEIYWRIDSASR